MSDAVWSVPGAVLPIGIFARTFPGSDPDLVLRTSVEAGIRHVQFNLVSAGLEAVPAEIPHAISTQIAAATKHNNARIDALSGTCNLIHPIAEVRSGNVRRLVALVGFCDQLSVPVLTLSTGTRDPYNLWRAHPENSSASAHHDLRQSLRELLTATAGCRVVLAFEPEAANVIQSADQAADLLDAFDADFGTGRLAVVLDLANLIGTASLTDQAAILQHACHRLHGRIALAHAKDLDADHRVVAPGQGRIDFAAYLRCLRDVAGYTGPVIMHGLDPHDVPAALAHLTAARDLALR